MRHTHTTQSIHYLPILVRPVRGHSHGSAPFNNIIGSETHNTGSPRQVNGLYKALSTAKNLTIPAIPAPAKPTVVPKANRSR